MSHDDSNILAYVLDGLADYLELERERGVKTVEIDRALLMAAPAPKAGAAAAPQQARSPSGAAQPARPPAESAVPPRAAGGAGDEAPKGDGSPKAVAGAKGPLDFVFLADRPLSPKAVEMMAKIIPAMGKTSETAPIVIVPPTPDVRAMPNARFFVFLGRAALARCMPGTRGEENRWLKSPGGRDVLLVKSPEEIVRFTTVTPALKRMKQEMWLALKTVMQRVRIGN